MATKKEPVNFEDNLTVARPQEDNEYKGPRVRIFLPRLEDSGDQGIAVDQYEHVTISNEEREDHYKVLRGEWVDVPVPVFMALRERYPKL